MEIVEKKDKDIELIRSTVNNFLKESGALFWNRYHAGNIEKKLVLGSNLYYVDLCNKNRNVYFTIALFISKNGNIESECTFQLKILEREYSNHRLAIYASDPEYYNLTALRNLMRLEFYITGA